MNQRKTLQEHIESLRRAYRAISTATDYCRGYLMWGTGCDSGKDKEFRMSYVMRAEREFVEQHKKEILARAAEIVAEELAPVGGIIDKHERNT